MNRDAFTLLELIFIIVIIGVLVGVGSSSFKTNYMRNDINFIMAKIKQAQYRGIGYEHQNFDGSFLADTIGCIDLEKSALEERASDGNLPYKLHINSFDAGVICFDAKGRPHEDDFTSATLLSEKKDIIITYSGKSKTITILPISGYVVKSCN